MTEEPAVFRALVSYLARSKDGTTTSQGRTFVNRAIRNHLDVHAEEQALCGRLGFQSCAITNFVNFIDPLPEDSA